MRNQHRMLLLVILIVAAASIVWALPSRAYGVHADTAAPSFMTSVPVCMQYWNDTAVETQSRIHSIAISQPNRLIAEPICGSRLDQHVLSSMNRIASEAVLRGTLDGRSALLNRRTSINHSTKRLLGTGAVSAETIFCHHNTTQFHCLIPTSTPTLVAIFDVPLNRGPTSSAC